MRAPLRVHWVRHGEVDSHHGNVSVTENGLARAEETGRRLGEGLDPGEVVSLLYAPTRRARETAEAIRNGVAISLDNREADGVELLVLTEEWALRNPDLYVAGVRVEMVSTPEALAEQIPGLGPEGLSGHPFFEEFWAEPDRVGYWVGHLNPPGEDAGTVARRLSTFAASLLDLPQERPRRYVCVTHSPVIRAFLRRYLTDEDPGEPDYLEAVDLDFYDLGPPAVRFRQDQGTAKP